MHKVNFMNKLKYMQRVYAELCICSQLPTNTKMNRKRRNKVEKRRTNKAEKIKVKKIFRGEEPLQTGVKWFYWIGAPGVGIKPKIMMTTKCLSEYITGSRCLKSKPYCCTRSWTKIMDQNNYEIVL